jgi:hypothetical protein
MANVKIPYALIPAVSVDQRRSNMLSAIARGLPRVDRCPAQDGVCHIACYGPSLRETYHELRGQHPIISMSGATKWLADRGIVADYAMEMDPRESQLTVSLPAVPGVTYLVASCVAPAFFDRLLEDGHHVRLWHTVSTNWDDECAWVAQHDPGQLVISTGSTVGLGAIQMGGVLGYNRFEIHGMDGSFAEDGSRHAGFHGGKTQKDKITWDAGGVTYRTSKIMANAVAETINTAKNYPILTTWHGRGLTQALIREANLMNACCADETAKRQKLSLARPKIVQMPPLPPKQPFNFWDALLPSLIPPDLPELIQNIAVCEGRRHLAKFNTGSIPWESAVYLRALCRFYQPSVIAEVGTFIGTSTLALNPGRVIYTCDFSNDCVPMSESIITHPYQTSTQMLREIQEKVDLFFFDGRLHKEDIPEIQRLMHPGTVFVTDDYEGTEKGWANIQLLAPAIPLHTLMTGVKPPSTLAAMVPFKASA